MARLIWVARDGILDANQDAVDSAFFGYALLIHIVIVADEVPALTGPIDIIDDSQNIEGPCMPPILPDRVGDHRNPVAHLPAKLLGA